MTGKKSFWRQSSIAKTTVCERKNTRCSKHTALSGPIMNKAVFLDRDGTVTEEVGYLSDLTMLRLLPDAGAAIKKLNQAGFKVIIVTNQSGVARGLFPESLVHEAHARLAQMLEKEGARLDGVYYCPHHPKAGNLHYTMACDCRKPGTGLVDRAVKELDIDPILSFMVGDKWSDVELGQRAGMKSVLVRTGFAPDDSGNMRPEHVKDPDFTARDLSETVELILKDVHR
ncbi:MAG TPA: D,D-heptose 1,7-bisphosphate phosphatase [Nitrospiraceae bacterium]|nr:D,D-heptose 1,7-bisphosphate phosphatase [Nitrospiraceae bacterium]